MESLFRSILLLIGITNRTTKGSNRIFAAAIHTVVVSSTAIGIGSTIVCYKVMRGFEREIQQKPILFFGHFSLVATRNTTQQEAAPVVRKQQLSSLLQPFAHRIERVNAFVQKPMLLHTLGGEIEGIACKGFDATDAYADLQDCLTAGRFPGCGKQAANEICLSASLSQKLRLQVGDRVLVHTPTLPPRYRKLQIVGLYQSHLKEVDEQLAFCNVRLLQRLNQWEGESMSGCSIFLKQGERPTPAFYAALRASLHPELRIIRTDKVYAAFCHWAQILRRQTAAFILFVLLVAGSTMAATVAVHLMERSYTMGVLKTLGCPSWNIRLVLWLVSLRTLWWGLFWGNGLGLATCWLQKEYRWLALDPSVYGLRHLPVAWDLAAVGKLNLCILGSMGGLLCATIWLLDKKSLMESLQEGN